MSATDKLSTALAVSKEEGCKTPLERCRDQMMKEWHVTKEDIDALPPEEAQALIDRIEQEVWRRMQTAAPRSTRSARAVSEAEPTATPRRTRRLRPP